MKQRKPILLAFLVGIGVLLYACKPSDAKLQKEVNDKLATAAPGVIAEVKGGVATLSGEVMDDAAKTTAEDAAKSVKGVKSVVNNVMLTPPPPPPAAPVAINPDDILKTSVDSSLSAAGITGVTATIANGEVTLTGTIKKADLRKVMQAANEAKPKKVNNKLTLQ
ncbi:BON domain-containing protein [Chitinophaga sp. GCM10012297]|uniref:BON domain-containing protein n=1 Tax=Chitinophaga chungangae TaxID=2821488 RepID=A0ABS3YF03_9BACT|nr:BON domain-containing protein [Chitinophaga chungangae]MBO9152694.1 BON domain-containing protein [Chitinophaga chungangae]